VTTEVEWPGIASPAIRAAECEHLAKLASNPETKNGYLCLAECWHGLAGNEEFVERLDNFLGYLKRKRRARVAGGALRIERSPGPTQQDRGSITRERRTPGHAESRS
jgi:hypothetical protein